MKLSCWLKSLFSPCGRRIRSSRRSYRQSTTLRRDLERHGNQPLPAWVEILESRVLLAATFSDPNVISSTASGALSVFAADVDGDGDMDALSASASVYGDDKIAWYENDGSQNFTEHVISTAADSSVSVFAADVDSDGDMDVLSASGNDDKISWYENDGSQNFTEHTISTVADSAASVFATDVDGDGDMDILSASPLDNTIAWYENDTGPGFTDHPISTTANGAASVFAADVDGDGDMDVLSASSLDDTIAWYENSGSGNFSARTISVTADGARSVFAADVDGDGDMDILSASPLDNTIAWYENDTGPGGRNFIPHTISTTSRFAFSVFAADVDGDGDMDVFSAAYLDDEIAWYENDGSQNFTPHTISTAANGAYGVFVADVDGDGNLDVLSASKGDNKIAWYENLNEDVGTITLSIDDVSQLEDGTFTLTITSDTVANLADITVVVNTADLVGQASAGSDYTAIVNQTVTITAGSTSTTVTVTVNDDAIVEDTQTFEVILSDAKIGGVSDPAQVVIGDGTGIGTIENNDTAILTISDITETETDSDFTVQATVTLNAEVEAGFDVAYSSDLDTAEANDVTVLETLAGQGSLLSFVGTAGETHAIDVVIRSDDIVEDNETFTITLGDVTGTSAAQDASITTGAVSDGLINNDDTATLTITDVTETETDSDFTVQATVTLSADVEGGFNLIYSNALGTAETNDVTVEGSQVMPGFDGTAGETRVIDVVIKGDDIEENNETFTITLGDVTGTSSVQDAAITTGAVSDGLIIDDDTPVPTINLDLDANGEATALTDGVLIVRSLFGVTGTQLTNGALGTGAVRTDPAEIIAFLEPGLTTMLDVDANGEATALTDGVLIVRYLFGVTGTQLTDGALGTSALRTNPVEIIAFLDGFLPAAASVSLVVSTQDTLIANYDAPAVSRLETRSATTSAADGTVVLVSESSALVPPSASRHFDAMNMRFPKNSSTFGNRPHVAFEQSLDRRDDLNWRLDTREVTSSPHLLRNWPRTTVVESAPINSDSLYGNSLSLGNEETPPAFELDEVFADLDQLFIDV
jgi:hypothetical protein